MLEPSAQATGNINDNLASTLAPYLKRVTAYTTVFGTVGSTADAQRLLLDGKAAVFINKSYVMMPESFNVSALQDGDYVGVASVPQDMKAWTVLMHEGGMSA